MSETHSADRDAGVLRLPPPTERCWECGSKATRIAPTAAPEDIAPPRGCDECFPHWPSEKGQADA